MNIIADRSSCSGFYSTYRTDSSGGPVSYAQSLSVEPTFPIGVTLGVQEWVQVPEEELRQADESQ